MNIDIHCAPDLEYLADELQAGLSNWISSPATMCAASLQELSHVAMVALAIMVLRQRTRVICDTPGADEFLTRTTDLDHD